MSIPLKLLKHTNDCIKLFYKKKMIVLNLRQSGKSWFHLNGQYQPILGFTRINIFIIVN